MSYPLDDLRRDGFMVLRGFLDPERRARLAEVAGGLRTRYLRCDPVTGRRGFQVSPWHLRHIDHPGFYDDAPAWWLPEVLGLEADPGILRLWQTATGEEPTFVYGALFMDPALPYAVDAALHGRAAPDGAGQWHRDSKAPREDEEERASLLSDAHTRDDRHLLEIALLASDAFEYVPGSHRRWDTPEELLVRKHGKTLTERTRPLPGGLRIPLEPGDAMLIDGRGIHRGWYTHGVARRTITLVYTSMDKLLRYPDDEDQRPRCFLEPAHLAGSSAGTRAFFERQIEYSAKSPADAR